MKCVIHGLLGGALMCIVGGFFGLEGRLPSASASTKHLGALPRFDVVNTYNGCDVVNHHMVDGTTTSFLDCN